MYVYSHTAGIGRITKVNERCNEIVLNKTALNNNTVAFPSERTYYSFTIRGNWQM